MATTEIYTYLHTLSLHDALPIYRRIKAILAQVIPTLPRQPILHLHKADIVIGVIEREPVDRIPALHQEPGMRSTGSRRSEEHTSELQSLMRSSYAVFCLKKQHKN